MKLVRECPTMPFRKHKGNLMLWHGCLHLRAETCAQRCTQIWTRKWFSFLPTTLCQKKKPWKCGRTCFFWTKTNWLKKKKHFLDYFKTLKDNFAKSKKRACKSAPEDVSTVLPTSVGSYMALKKMNQLLSQLEDLIKNKPKKDTPPASNRKRNLQTISKAVDCRCI